MAGGMRQFWGELPRPARYLLSTVGVQHLGRGMTLPFTVIYLHEVRGFSLETAGVLMGLISAVAAVLAGPGGALTDAWGARRVLIASSVSQSLGALVMAVTTTVPVAVAGCVLLGISASIGWPAASTFISSVVDGQLRQRYFGVNFALLNLGIGVGGLIAGAAVDVDRSQTFVAIFLLDAVLALIPAGWLLGPLRRVQARAEVPDEADQGSGYLQVLRLPGMSWILAATVVLSVVGYGQMEAGVPAFARSVAELSTRTVGLLFAANTAVIVLLQFAVLNLVEGHRRTRVMLVLISVWVASWLALGASGLLPGTLAAAVLAVGYGAVFGLGETMLQPTLPALTNELAPDHLRGRLNAATSAAFMAGGVLGPVVAGQLLGRGWPTAFILLMILGLAAAAWMVRHIERLVPASANGLLERQPAAVP